MISVSSQLCRSLSWTATPFPRGPFSDSHCARREGTHARVGGNCWSPSVGLWHISGSASCQGMIRPQSAPSRMMTAEGPWVVIPTRLTRLPFSPNQFRRFSHRPSEVGQTPISHVESGLSKSTFVALVPTSIPSVNESDICGPRTNRFIAGSLHCPATKLGSNSVC